MAVVEIRTEREMSWALGNPWLWIGVGLLSSVAALAWVNLLGDQATEFRLVLVATGLLTAGAAVSLRLNSPRQAYLDMLPSGSRSLVTGALFLAFASMVLYCVIRLAFGLIHHGLGGDTGGVLLLTVLVAPTAGWVAWLCLDRCQNNKSLGKPGESAAIVVLAALCAFVCCWALYVPEAPSEWDSLRLFLGVLTAVALVGAGLLLLPVGPRRIILSILILLHFGGILTAVMIAPPTPWVFRQLWGRLYRPYLQFLYLNNAYHFYAPEPGPSCFLWFRVEHQNLNNPADKIYSWVEFPKIREDGTPDYPFSLLYQRRLAMTDHVQHWDTTPPPDRKLTGQVAKFYEYLWKWRYLCSNMPPNNVTEEELAKVPIKVPFYPANLIAINQQFREPTFYAKKMIQSFAYHMLKEPSKHPGYKVASVKVYKVVHVVSSDAMIAAGIEPTNPILYQPYYMGKFKLEPSYEPGKEIALLVDEPKFDEKGMLKSGDPLLYWLLPMLPNNGFEASTLDKATIQGWAYRHAGDDHWIWYPGDRSPQVEK
jgi:hypothetical protein